jgi:hypothetical protein
MAFSDEVFQRHFKITRSARDKGDQIVIKVTNYDNGQVFSLNDLPMQGAPGSPENRAEFIHTCARVYDVLVGGRPS